MKLYLAGPLFTLAEQRFNKHLAESLCTSMSGLDVILPQERAKDLLGKPDGLELVFKDCFAMIDACDAVLAILDGPDADSGTCVELGYAWARRKPVVGIRTDFRISEDRGLNLMVSHVCKVLLLVTSEDLESLSKKICETLGQIRASNRGP
jgi:nucleoside 2-deoxyribosyltransferase